MTHSQIRSIISFTILAQVAYIFSDLWLAYWTEEEEKKQAMNESELNQSEMVSNYSVIGMAVNCWGAGDRPSFSFACLYDKRTVHNKATRHM